MRLQSVNYVEYEGQPEEWRLEGLELRQSNLLVGRNATGKSRTLKLVKGLAALLKGQVKLMFDSGDYEATFVDDVNARLDYSLAYRDRKVIREGFEAGGVSRLERADGGKGQIWAEKLGKMLDFQCPENELAAAARRDSVQHPFFEPLYQWAERLLYYPFSGDLGQTSFAVLLKDQHVTIDPKDPSKVVGIYLLGKSQLGVPFVDAVREDMVQMGYPLDTIEVQPSSRLAVQAPLPGPLSSLCVKEASVASPLDQMDLSQGMFRALSLIIQLNYAKLAQLEPSLILVDDIGEGLDFERACELVRIVMRLAREASSQLLMATNDRFVMNAVPLDDWSVLHRQGAVCKVYNYGNSREAFENFKFTGLNNFDFFSTDFVCGGGDG